MTPALPLVPSTPPEPRLPVEALRHHGWVQACLRTLLRTLLHPWASFHRCPEPVPHGRVLAYLATLRLPLWLVLVAILVSRLLVQPEPSPVALHSIHAVLSPSLARALSVWLVLMVPVGLPLLYFSAGLLAHVGIALTGGAPRSIGTSMRAVGYALGPAVLMVGLLDLPLYLGDLEFWTLATCLGLAAAGMVLTAGGALARTHQISGARGLLVAVFPAVLFVAVSFARAALVLPEIPGLEGPSEAYYVP